MEVQQSEIYTVDELGEKWGRLVSPILAQIIIFEKQNAQLIEQNNQLAADLGNMRERLRVAEMELLKKEGKEIIDSAGE